RQRIPGAERRHTGIVGIFGRTPLTRVNLSVLGPMLSNAGIMAIGSRGRVCFCTAMRFREPPSTAAKRFGIEGDNWPSDDYFMWAIAVRRREGTQTGERDASTRHRLASQTIEGFHDDFRALIEGADVANTVLVPIRATPSIRRSGPSRVTLIGDAIHTMPPFGAHGATTAFKDAQVFASAFSDGCESPSAMQAIRAFEARMDRYSRPIIKSAKRQMAMATVDFPFKQRIVRTLFRAAGAFSRNGENGASTSPGVAETERPETIAMTPDNGTTIVASETPRSAA